MSMSNDQWVNIIWRRCVTIIRIAIIKIRGSWDSLIFIMGLPSLVRLCLYILSVPDERNYNISTRQPTLFIDDNNSSWINHVATSQQYIYIYILHMFKIYMLHVFIIRHIGKVGRPYWLGIVLLALFYSLQKWLSEWFKEYNKRHLPWLACAVLD